MAQHVRLDANPAVVPAPSTILGEAGGGEGAPRSLVKTNGDAALSRCSLRSGRISSPRNGCLTGVPYCRVTRFDLLALDPDTDLPRWGADLPHRQWHFSTPPA
jgi:hypothetical protein